MVMAHVRTNGASHDTGVLDLGETTQESFTVKLDGQLHDIYIVTNRRYPKTVAALLDAAREEWQNARDPDDDSTPVPSMVEAVRDLLGEGELTVPGKDGFLQIPAERIQTLRKSLEEYDGIPRFKANWAAWEHYLNKAITLLSNPPITYVQADNMDTDKRLELLIRSDYLKLNQQETEAQNPPKASDSTGEKPAPDLPVSTE